VLRDFPCDDVDANIEAPLKDASIRDLGDLVRILAALRSNRSDSIERDLVTVTVYGCARKAVLRLTVGVDVSPDAR